MIETLMNDAGLSCVIFLGITLILKLILIIGDDALKESYTGRAYLVLWVGMFYLHWRSYL